MDRITNENQSHEGFSENLKYTGKRKSRLMAFVLTFLFGPFGFLFIMGAKSFFIALVWYVAIGVLSAGVGLPFIWIFGAIIAAIGIETQVKTREYIEYENKLKQDRKNREMEYREKIGITTSQKMKYGIFADPNRRKSLSAMSRSLAKVLQGDFSQLNIVGKHLRAALDPVDFSYDEDDEREVHKQHNNNSQSKK